MDCFVASLLAMTWVA